MRKLRIAVLMHAALVPPKSIEGLSDEQIDLFKMEYDVCAALHNLGHEVIHVPVEDDLAPIRRVLRERRPHIAFNLLMHFHDAGIYDSAVVSWLELSKQHYSGCNPRGLFVANDKALCKKVFAYHRIRAPRFFVVGRGKKAKGLPKGAALAALRQVALRALVHGHQPGLDRSRPGPAAGTGQVRARQRGNGGVVRGVHRRPRADRRDPRQQAR